MKELIYRSRQCRMKIQENDMELGLINNLVNCILLKQEMKNRFTFMPYFHVDIMALEFYFYCKNKWRAFLSNSKRKQVVSEIAIVI